MSDEVNSPEQSAEALAAMIAAEEERRRAAEKAAADRAAEEEAARRAEDEAIREAIAAAEAEAEAARKAAEKAEADALAAALAEVKAVAASAKPDVRPQDDEVNAPAGADGRPKFGPAFASELETAGLLGLPFSYDHERGVLLFDPGISAEDRARVVTVVEAHDPTKPAPTPHAMKVSAAQAKIALYDHGFLDEAEEIVKAHPYPPVRIWWASANDWEMSNPYVPAVAAELGLEDEDLQELFDYAATR